MLNIIIELFISRAFHRFFPQFSYRSVTDSGKFDMCILKIVQMYFRNEKLKLKINESFQ